VKERQFEEHSISVKEGDSQFAISYDPGQRFMSGSFPGYTVTDVLKQTSLHNALRSKAERLKSTPADLVTGIVACNGGSSIFAGHRTFRRTMTAGHVAQDIIRQYSSLGFILLIDAVRPLRTVFSTSDRANTEIKWWLTLGRSVPSDGRIPELMKRVMAEFPKPVVDALNASHRAHEIGCGVGYRGGWTMDGKTIKLSVRAVLELLAGRLSPERFADAHGWTRPSTMGRTNHFELMLSQGRTVTEVAITSTDDDDDWITFKFGDPDPAISPFRAPSSGGPKPPKGA